MAVEAQHYAVSHPDAMSCKHKDYRWRVQLDLRQRCMTSYTCYLMCTEHILWKAEHVAAQQSLQKGEQSLDALLKWMP